MSKQINALTALTDAQVNDNTKLVLLGNPVNGQLFRGTMAQMKTAFGTKKTKFVAVGTEGATLTISELAGMNILLIAREGAVMDEVTATPDTVEYIWDGTIITLGLAVNPGERFVILYTNN